VRAVDRDDRLLGQIGIRVVLGDGRVVPAGDVAGEDAAQRLGGEVQLLDALEVEHHGDRGDVDGDVEGLLAVADLGGGGQLLLVHGVVAEHEVNPAGQELITTGAGYGDDVGYDKVAALCAGQAHEGLGPRGQGVLHRGGAGGGQVAGQLPVAVLRAAADRGG